MAEVIERELTAWMADPDNMDRSNIIHSTGGAQAFGFRGALITGSVVYGWCTPAILDALGEQWLHEGWASVRFRRPVYPDDALRVTVRPLGDGTWSLEVFRGEDELALVGTLGNGGAPGELLADFVDSPAVAPVDPPVPAPLLKLEEIEIGKQLPTLVTSLPQPAVLPGEMTTHDTLGGVILGGEAYANPAGVSGRMSWYGHSVYDYGGPSIHTTSAVQYVRGVKSGEPIHIGAVIRDAYERNGDHYIVYDGTMRNAEGDVVARVRHTTIFHVAPRQS